MSGRRFQNRAPFRDLSLSAKGACVVAIPVFALSIAFVIFYNSMDGIGPALVAGSVAGILGAFAAMYLFTRGIVRRVQRVQQLTHCVEDERTSDEAPGAEPSGGDEIARLERTLHETSRLMGVQSEQLRAAHDEMERRVGQRTAELSQANEELRVSNDMRQMLIRSSPLAIWSLDTEGRVVFWSPAAERIFGWTEREAVGRILPVIPESRRSEFEEALRRLSSGDPLEAAERTHQRKDGKLIEVAIWSVPLYDASTKVVGFLTFEADITERKQLEEQFRQSQKLEAVGRLAGGVAHDFNNLLTVIMGYVEMLMIEARTKGAPTLVEYGQEIQHAAERAGALTGQLLAFSRRQITQPRSIDLNETIEHSMKLLRRVIGEDIAIRTHLDAGLWQINADPIHIDQAIMNLVVNARDAMPNGGTLTVETANVMLDDAYGGRHLDVKAGAYAMLAVSDTGMGMNEEVRQRIFEPFFTTKEPGKGTGLGLSIVYGVVKQNLGDVMVYSEPGKGTSFKLYFPMAEAQHRSHEVLGKAAELRGDETILLCEDEERIRKLVNAMLTRQGYKVLEAGTPEAAIAMSNNYAASIDLLFTDIVMPQMSGFDLAKEIREARPRIKVLYMSGYTDNRVSSAWVLDVDTPFLHKPFTASVLAQKVREALGEGAGSRTAETHSDAGR
jgi:two-component system cell cycle sensor histidine kinase/response regulator CckA